MRIEWRMVKRHLVCRWVDGQVPPVGTPEFDGSAPRPMSPEELVKACVGK